MRSGLRITPESVAVRVVFILAAEMLAGCRGEALTRLFWGARHGWLWTQNISCPVGCDTLTASGGWQLG
ncbi:hypothetical protein C5824_21575 [Salmonella enterica]|nr:hypothetical protein [Salmonella enterica]